MLKIMRESLNAAKLDSTMEAQILDHVSRGEVRDIIMEALGEPADVDPDEISEDEMEKLIDSIPETDIDDADEIMESTIVAHNEYGDKVNVDCLEAADQLIPDAEEDDSDDDDEDDDDDDDKK